MKGEREKEGEREVVDAEQEGNGAEKITDQEYQPLVFFLSWCNKGKVEKQNRLRKRKKGTEGERSTPPEGADYASVTLSVGERVSYSSWQRLPPTTPFLSFDVRLF